MYISDYNLVDSNTYQVIVEDSEGAQYTVCIESDRSDAGIEYNIYGNCPFEDDDLIKEFLSVLEKDNED